MVLLCVIKLTILCISVVDASIFIASKAVAFCQGFCSSLFHEIFLKIGTFVLFCFFPRRCFSCRYKGFAYRFSGFLLGFFDPVYDEFKG